MISSIPYTLDHSCCVAFIQRICVNKSKVLNVDLPKNMPSNVTTTTK